MTNKKPNANNTNSLIFVRQELSRLWLHIKSSNSNLPLIIDLLRKSRLILPFTHNCLARNRTMETMQVAQLRGGVGETIDEKTLLRLKNVSRHFSSNKKMNQLNSTYGSRVEISNVSVSVGTSVASASVSVGRNVGSSVSVGVDSSIVGEVVEEISLQIDMVSCHISRHKFIS